MYGTLPMRLEIILLMERHMELTISLTKLKECIFVNVPMMQSWVPLVTYSILIKMVLVFLLLHIWKFASLRFF